MTKRKYEKGKQIKDIKQLNDTDFIYIKNKIWHPAWWGSLQYSYLQRLIKEGAVYFADRLGG